MAGWATLDAGAASLFRTGTVIPAHPLALTSDRKLDERRQRALTRYYAAAGAGGIAVAVHTTQFTIRDHGLLEPVLALAAEAWDAATHQRPTIRIAGVAGSVAQAVAEAELARSLGYSAVLVSPGGLGNLDESGLLERSAAIGGVLPVIGFYLQEAVGGRRLSRDYWRELANQDSTIGVKAAPFDRYQTLELVLGVAQSDRSSEVVLYTGNDDNIIGDLSADFTVLGRDNTLQVHHFVGGLLGHWSVWTRFSVECLRLAHAARAGDSAASARLQYLAAPITDANAAVFDSTNGFAGVIAGVHEVLRRQGLLAGTWCLDPNEGLSPGQAEELTRVSQSYPWLAQEDRFIVDHLEDWLR